jgi:hypothetical protein
MQSVHITKRGWSTVYGKGRKEGGKKRPPGLVLARWSDTEGNASLSWWVRGGVSILSQE